MKPAQKIWKDTNNGNLHMENTRIIFRNFSGEEGKFNRRGNRNFNVIIESEDIAEQLRAEGWNIGALAPRDEGDAPTYHMNVTVRFDNFPPIIKTVTRRNQVTLTEETVGNLDYADIAFVDLTINPSHWEVNGSTGIKAYLKTAYVNIEEDAFAAKYAEEEYPEEAPW